jgi:hypothetical protein
VGVQGFDSKKVTAAFASRGDPQKGTSGEIKVSGNKGGNKGVGEIKVSREIKVSDTINGLDV